jgi:hypothetical protein
MSTVLEIEQAVTRLSEQDLEKFREWFAEYDGRLWDEQFERAAISGRLDKLANQAVADFRAGKYKEL